MSGDLFQLALQGIKRRKKSSFLLFAVLCLSFAFAIVTLSVSGSITKTNEEYRKDTFGEWQGAIPDGLSEDEAYLEDQPWLSRLGTAKSLGTVFCDAGQVAVGTADEAFFEVGRIGLQDGRLPEHEDEIAMEATALSKLGYDYTLGQTLELEIALPGSTEVPVTRAFTLCGVLKEYTSLWSAALPGWQGTLSSGLVTPEAAALLRQEAEAEADKMEQAAKEAIDEAKDTGEEPDPNLSGQTVIVLETPAPQYFFTVREGADEEMEEAVNGYLASFTEGNPRHKVYRNTLAYGDSGEEEINTFYAGLLFGVMVLAVLCIYATQLQKQVRQYALFRSIGIKKSQLRKLMSFETLLLCVPAVVLGAALGTLGTWAVLRLAVYSGSAPIQVSIPWGLLWPLMLVWLLGIVLARLVILQLALHAPLTGRISMENRKARRFKRAQKALIGALSVLLCGAVAVTVTVSLPSFKEARVLSQVRSYVIDNGSEGDPLPIITEEFLQTLKAVPGVADVWTVGVLEAKLNFEGMESNDFVEVAKEVQNGDISFNNGHLSKYQDGLGVRVYVIPEENYGNFLHPAEIGLDVEAFRKGEQVVVSFPQDIDGQFYLTYPVYEEEDGGGGYTIYTKRRYASDTGLRAGDTVTLEFFGKEPYTYDEDNRKTLYKTNTVVGAIAPVIADTGRENASEGLESVGCAYVVWCSEEFAKNVFADAADFPGKKSINGSYVVRRAGKTFGYTLCAIGTNSQAGYVSTDTVVAQLCEQNRLTLQNQREYLAAALQETTQTLVLLLSTGGCAILVLILLLGNILALEAEREKKNYGILQALGISKKQLRRRLAVSALLRGLWSALAGWVLMGVYVMYSAYQNYLWVLDGPEELRITWTESFWAVIDRYQVAGADAWFLLLLTAGAIALTAGISLLTKRSFLQGDLMEKIRDE